MFSPRDYLAVIVLQIKMIIFVQYTDRKLIQRLLHILLKFIIYKMLLN